jgi:putative ABC transport system permease protein
MLTRDLAFLQEDTGRFPGYFLVRFDGAAYDREGWPELYRWMHERHRSEMFRRFGIAVLAASRRLAYDMLDVLPETQREREPVPRDAVLAALDGLPSRIRIIEGRAFEATPPGEPIEVIAAKATAFNLDLRLGETYVAHDRFERLAGPLRLRLVGLFEPDGEPDLWWFDDASQFDRALVMSYEQMNTELMLGPRALPAQASWYFALDYREVTPANLERVLAGHEEITRWARRYGGARVDMPAAAVLARYPARERELRTTLWVLQVPVLVVLALYLFLTSRLVIRTEAGEIAALKSRGSRSAQILAAYGAQSLILAGAALLAGPPLGMVMCRLLGATSGFLVFVRRAGLRLVLDSEAYLYALLALAVAISAMVLPAVLAARRTVVIYKRTRSREQPPAALSLLVGLVLVGIAVYALVRFSARQQDLAATGAAASELSVDPLLFLASTIFVAGAALFLVQGFPLVVRIVYRSARRLWPPALYAAFVQIARGGGNARSLTLFLVLSVATGIYGAGAARTINANAEDRIRYAHGADITLRSEWQSNRPPESEDAAGPLEDDPFAREALLYQEPPFAAYGELEGIERATRVFVRDDVSVQLPTGASVAGVRFMAVVPHEFAEVAWFRRDLLDHHWNAYLNLLTSRPSAALISRTLADERNLRLGDVILAGWAGQGFLPLVVHAVVDFWPAYNPHRRPAIGGEKTHLVVTNLAYVHARMALEPYDVWLKKALGATSEQVYRDIEKHGLRIERLEDAAQDLLRVHADPLLQGTNGSLTLGFLVALALTAAGFVVFWAVSLEERTLQLGLLRASGLPARSVVGMLAFEQGLICSFAFAAGILIGGAASRLFVPVLQITAAAEQQVPPFRVIASRADYLRVSLVAAVMVFLVTTVLAGVVKRLRIHQAIKLGEE